MANPSSVRVLARASAGAMAMTAVLFVAGLAAAAVGRGVAADAIRSDDLTYADLDRALLRAGALAQALFIPLALAAFAWAGLFVAWLHRARRNLDRLEGAQPKWGWGWTLAGWVIPVANVIVPAAVVLDIARESLPSPGRRRFVMSSLIFVWWATVLGWLALAVLPSTRSVGTAPVGVAVLHTSDEQRVDPALRGELGRHLDGPLVAPDEVGSAALLVAAAALGIVLVRRITAAQCGRLGDS